MQPLDLRAARAIGHEQRHEMLFRRVRQRRLRRAVAIIGKRGFVARQKFLVRPLCEGARPFRFRPAVPVDGAQIMHETTRAQDQHAFLAQRRKRAAQYDVMRRAHAALHRNLKYGNVRLRIHQHEGHPGAVIEAALGIDGGSAQERRCALGERGRAGSVVAQFVKRFRETGEIVNCGVALHRIQRRRRGLPMRRGDEDCLGRSEFGAQAAQEIARRNGVERQGR